MEFITSSDLELIAPEQLTKIFYNHFEFIQSGDGFVQVHVKSTNEAETSAVKQNDSIKFSVYFGVDHPL